MKIAMVNTNESIINQLIMAARGTRMSFVKSPKVSNTEQEIQEDITLLEKLVRRGASHSKGLRMIYVFLEITAPRYWWSEFDTYKVGTTSLSESTMHTLCKRLLMREDFEDERIDGKVLSHVNQLIMEGADIAQVKGALPEGFLQCRLVHVNYQTLRTMYFDRRNHRLTLWKDFCGFLESLPCSTLITVEGDEKKVQKVA